MKKGRFAEHQIVSALKKQEADITVKDISRELSIENRAIKSLLEKKL